VFHCKTIPWFVSDTTSDDFYELLDILENPSLLMGDESVANADALKDLAATWRGYLSRGEWTLRSDRFWTKWWAYCHLPEASPDLFSSLSSSSLVIFKGDLNYRKLIYDCRWPATTPFRDAIGQKMGDAIPLISLRTNKSDPCVGLEEGKEETLLQTGFKDWRWSGKFAIAQFSKP
jgi:damage-control phosphatase, subfamily III